MHQGIQKAVVAAITQIVALLALFGIEAEWATPELILGVGGLITTILVYTVPNVIKQEGDDKA